jgi:hypothetical protein
MLTPMQTTNTCSLNPKARQGFIKPKTSENTLKYIRFCINLIAHVSWFMKGSLSEESAQEGSQLLCNLVT